MAIQKAVATILRRYQLAAVDAKEDFVYIQCWYRRKSRTTTLQTGFLESSTEVDYID